MPNDQPATAGGTRAAPGYRVIGTPRQKVDAVAKVTGALRFADDLVLPRMLHCVMLRASLPHARIVRIDTSRAAAHPGVIAVMTGEALPITFGILPITQDEHALCIDRVRFVGDPVAAVAAIDEETARAACDLIDVEYDPLPSIGSIEQALTTPEPQIHDYADAGNVHKHVALDFGGVDDAMQKADVVREDVFFYEGNTHLGDGAACRARRVVRRGKADAVVEHADAALRAPRGEQGVGDESGARPRDRHA